MATLLISVALLLALAAPALGMKLKFPARRTYRAPPPPCRHTTGSPRPSRATAPATRSPCGHPPSRPTGCGPRSPTSPAVPPPTRSSRRPRGGAIQVSADRRVSVLEVATPHASRSDEASRSLHELREDLVPATLGRIPGVEYAVGGGVAASEDYAAHIWAKLPIVAAFVLALTFLVMAWTFRSIVVALTSIVLNLLSAGAAYGLLVLVFQSTWAEGLLGFTSMDAIVTWLPLFLFVVLLDCRWTTTCSWSAGSARRSTGACPPGRRWRTASPPRPAW
ncbi:MMPL family transporter [Micromonospora sp. BRA006-A]|nr:MMPL family transporter [Micromonospora sp. BRA006-A]